MKEQKTTGDLVLTRPMEIIKADEHGSAEATDVVIAEHRLPLFINGQKCITFYCTPQDLEELIAGHLYTSGIISHKEEILEMEIKENAAFCNVKKLKSSYNDDVNKEPEPMDKSTVQRIMDETLTGARLFFQTGGVHCAGVFHKGKSIAIREDVARHNAVDKVIGHCFLQGISLWDKALVLSGRVSADMLKKASCTGIKMIFSKSAPTDLAVQLAKRENITLAGFIREQRMNLYAGAQRIFV